MDVDQAIERLRAALRAIGAHEFAPPRDAAAVDAIREAIAPLRLPEAVARFYERVDPRTLAVEPHPLSSPPDVALDGWLQHRDGAPGMVPELLFPICYESWSFLFVELDTPDQIGGRLFSWAYGGSDYRLRFASVADWLDTLAETLEQGGFTRRGRAVVPDQERFERLGAERLGSEPLVVGEQRRAWPLHWHARSFDPGAQPRGATHTIAELLSANPPAGATVAGAFSRVAHVHGAGERLSVVDGTGVLDVWCPSTVARFAAVGDADYMEFDVTTDVSADTWEPPPRPERSSPPGTVAPNPRRVTFTDELRLTPPRAIVQAVRRAEPGAGILTRKGPAA